MEDRIPELYQNLVNAFDEYHDEVDELRREGSRQRGQLRSYEETIRKLAEAAQVADRRLGRWEIIDNGPQLENGQIVVRPPSIKCTACGSEAVVVLHMGPVLTPFCPWCGAQMANPERRQRNDRKREGGMD